MKAVKNHTHKKLAVKSMGAFQRAAAKVICSYENLQDGFRLDHSKIPEVLTDHDFTYILQFGYPAEPELLDLPHRRETLEELKQ